VQHIGKHGTDFLGAEQSGVRVTVLAFTVEEQQADIRHVKALLNVSPV